MSAYRQHQRIRPTGSFRKLALATVALVLCAGVSACMAISPPSPPPAAPTEEALPVPSDGAQVLPSEGELDAGTYLVDHLAVPLEVTVPEGWISNGEVLYTTEKVETGSGVFITFKNVASVPTDACAWQGAIIDIDPSVDGFVDAMMAQQSSTTTEPVELTGDHRAVEFDFAVEDGVDVADCDGGRFCLHSEVPDWCTRWYRNATEHESDRVVDVDGERIVMSLGIEGSVDATLAAEARAVFESINDLH